MTKVSRRVLDQSALLRLLLGLSPRFHGGGGRLTALQFAQHPPPSSGGIQLTAGSRLSAFPIALWILALTPLSTEAERWSSATRKRQEHPGARSCHWHGKGADVTVSGVGFFVNLYVAILWTIFPGAVQHKGDCNPSVGNIDRFPYS